MTFYEKPTLIKRGDNLAIYYLQWCIGEFGEYNEIECYPSIFALTKDEFETVKDFYHAHLHLIELILAFPKTFEEIPKCDFSVRELQALEKSEILNGHERGLLRVLWSYKTLYAAEMSDINHQEPITCIYLMMDMRSRHIKIGRSNKPEYRESTLQAEQPLIETIFVWKGNKSDETFWHNHFASKRTRGEWFNLNDNDVAFLIASVIANAREIYRGE